MTNNATFKVLCVSSDNPEFSKGGTYRVTYCKKEQHLIIKSASGNEYFYTEATKSVDTHSGKCKFKFV